MNCDLNSKLLFGVLCNFVFLCKKNHCEQVNYSLSLDALPVSGLLFAILFAGHTIRHPMIIAIIANDY